MSNVLSQEDQRLAQRLADGGLWPLLQRDWYERGTFTPSFAGTTIAGTFTYTIREGDYVRMGPLVHVWLRMAISAISVAPTGNLTISGLPMASVASQPFVAAPLATVSNIDYRAGVLELTGRITAGESSIRIFETYDNAATVSYPAASFTNAAASITAYAAYLVE